MTRKKTTTKESNIQERIQDIEITIKKISDLIRHSNDLMNSSEKDLEELKSLISQTEAIKNNTQFNQKDQARIDWGINERDQDKQKLIGILPYVLLEKKYFSDNATLVMFAKKYLKVNIRYHSSKSRASIIGSIITEVAKKEPNEIKKFIKAIDNIINKPGKDKVQNFFWEWDEVIRG